MSKHSLSALAFQSSTVSRINAAERLGRRQFGNYCPTRSSLATRSTARSCLVLTIKSSCAVGASPSAKIFSGVANGRMATGAGGLAECEGDSRKEKNEGCLDLDRPSHGLMEGLKWKMPRLAG